MIRYFSFTEQELFDFYFFMGDARFLDNFFKILPTVINGRIYVSNQSGTGIDASYSGLHDYPFDDLQQAVDLVSSIYGGTGVAGSILVDQGTYDNSADTSLPVVSVKDGASLEGGYVGWTGAAWGWTTRDTSLYPTIFIDVSTAAGSPNATVEFDGSDSDITTATILDGFTIIGANYDGSAAVYCHGDGYDTITTTASPTIQNNKIAMGRTDADGLSGDYWYFYGILVKDNASPVISNNEINNGVTYNSNTYPGLDDYTNSIGIRIMDGSSPLITGNTIYGGQRYGSLSDAGSNYYGIYIGSSTGNYCSPTISSANTINGSINSNDGNNAYGIYIKDNASPLSDPLVIGGTTAGEGNIITGGARNGNNDAVDYSYGIYIENSSYVTIGQNSISGGQIDNWNAGGRHTYGVYITSGTDITINNSNTVSGGTYSEGDSFGIYLAGTSTVTIDGNTSISAGGLDNDTDTSAGIKIDSTVDASSSVTISNNGTIDGGYGGTGNPIYGILIDSANPPVTISGNTKIAGDILGATTATGPSYGIYNNGATISVTGNGDSTPGNTIQGGSTTVNAYAIYNNGGSATISQNYIDGGSGANSYGIYNNLCSPTISQNYSIAGGSGTTASHGIYSYGSSSTSYAPIIYRNTINGGSGGLSYGVYDNNYLDSVVYNNIISGGEVGCSKSHGVFVDYDSNTFVLNNTILGGQGSSENYGVFLHHNSLPTIKNNIIFMETTATKICIREGIDSADPVSVKNNNFYDSVVGGTFLFYYDDADSTNGQIDSLSDAGDDVTTGDGNLPLDNWGNISENPGFAADYSLTVSTLVNTYQGGLDLSVYFTDDYTGTPNIRTTGTLGGPTNTGAAGWSMGAFEYDSP